MAMARWATKSTMMAMARWATAMTMVRSDDDYDDDGGDGATGDEVDMMAMTTAMATARREITMVTTMAKGNLSSE